MPANGRWALIRRLKVNLYLCYGQIIKFYLCIITIDILSAVFLKNSCFYVRLFYMRR